MTAAVAAMFLQIGVFVMSFCFDISYQQTEFQVCYRCEGWLQNGTAVGDFCNSFSGQVDGRCCLRHQQALGTVSIVGLDLSNCSLHHVEDLHEAMEAVMIDLSANAIVNMSESVFQGFTQLRYLRLPLNLPCPGGNASWEKVESKGKICFCEQQKNACYQTGNMSWDCPENSLCAPDGPGFFQCSCTDKYYGYKCLREGQFPTIEVFGVLGVVTVVAAILLWITQRRKAKST